MAFRLSQLSGREQGMLALACCMVLVMLADNLVVGPSLRRLKRMDIGIDVARRQLRHNRTMLQLEEPVTAEYGKVRDLIGEEDTETGEIERLKSQLDELASRTGLSLRAMRHLAPSRDEFLVTYQIDVSEFSGETISLLNFLHALHDAPGMLRAARLSVAAPDESTVVRGSMVITKVMTIKDASAATAPEA